MGDFLAGFAACWTIGAIVDFRNVMLMEYEERVRFPVTQIALIALCWPYFHWHRAEAGQ